MGKPHAGASRRKVAYPVIYNRFTGIIERVGKPFAPESFLREEAKPFQPLWRYMDIAKFSSLLETKSLYFRRLDLLRAGGNDPDTSEGVLAPGGQSHIAKIDHELSEGLGIDLNPEEIMRGYQIHASCSWVSCWTMKSFEDHKMWTVYAPAPSSVVIRTNVQRLQLSLKASPEALTFGKVRYSPLESPRPLTMSWNNPSFHKPERFMWEEEYRILRNLGASERMPHDDPKWHGRLTKVRLRQLVAQIRMHPSASSGDFETVRHLLAKYVPEIAGRVRRSALLPQTV
jgi:hypothetical protein